MAHRARKKRYQSEGNPFPPITLTGHVHLKYEDEYTGEPQKRGDIRFYLHDDATNKERTQGDYYTLGHAGYLKAEVFDGKKWCLVVMDDLFPDKIHHFTKKEQPAATYLVCEEAMKPFQGRQLERIYREHYALIPLDEVD